MVAATRSTTPTPKDAKKQAKRAEEKAEEKAKKAAAQASKAASAGSRDIPMEVPSTFSIKVLTILPVIVLGVSHDFIDFNRYILILAPVFVLTNFLVVGSYFYIHTKVKDLSKEEKIRCPAVVVKGVQISGQRVLTPYDYENNLCMARMNSTMFSLWGVAAIYFFMGRANFLAAQTVYSATKTWEPLFKCYVLGIEDRSFLTKPAQD